MSHPYQLDFADFVPDFDPEAAADAALLYEPTRAEWDMAHGIGPAEPWPGLSDAAQEELGAELLDAGFDLEGWRRPEPRPEAHR